MALAGAADLPERQRTLERTLVWSYELLGPTEQTLFRRAAVFSGGWTLEAAESVCADDSVSSDSVLDVLGRLVDTSLVEVNESNDEARYRFLQIVHDYATERLAESGELTPKLSLRRRVIVDRYADVIDAMYAEGDVGTLAP